MSVTIPPFPRRKFLSGSLAIAGSSLLGQRLAAVDVDERAPLAADRVALLSDPHITGDPTSIIYGTKWPGSPVKPGQHEGVKAADCLAQAVREVLNQEPRPAHVVVNGDCAHTTGLSEEYVEFLRLIAPLRAAGITVHVTIGNHDNRERLWASIPDLKTAHADRHVGVVALPKVDIVLLDSEQGSINEAQFAWLEQHLQDHVAKPVIVFGHYNPRPHTDGRPIDGFNGNDGRRLLSLLSSHKQVKALFYGHTHHWSVDRMDELHLINLPSVGPIFAIGTPYGWVDMQLTGTGAALKLQCINQRHADHAQRLALHWQKG